MQLGVGFEVSKAQARPNFVLCLCLLPVGHDAKL